MASEQGSRIYSLQAANNPADSTSQSRRDFPATSIQNILETMFSEDFMENGSTLSFGQSNLPTSILATFEGDSWEINETYINRGDDLVFEKLNEIFPTTPKKEARRQLRELSEQYDFLKRIFFHQSFWRAGEERVPPEIDQPHLGQTPLSEVLDNFTIVVSEIKRIADLLLAAGANIENVQLRRTTLWHAAGCGYTSIVERLLATGADKEAISENEATPLYVAAQYGNREVVKLLLEAGANRDAARSDGTTPLYVAAWSGHREIVEILLAAGANGNATNKDGATPLYIAASNGHREIVELLLAAGASKRVVVASGETPLSIAAYKGHREIVKLLATGVNKEADLYLATPLYHAASKGRREIVELLLAAGANKEEGYCGETPLYIAAKNDRREIVELLLAAGVDKEAGYYYYGVTPLFIAAKNGHREIVELLLAAGANKDATDGQYGSTPLYTAAYSGHQEIVRVLLGDKASEENINECFRRVRTRSPAFYFMTVNSLVHRDSTQPSLSMPSSSSSSRPSRPATPKTPEFFPPAASSSSEPPTQPVSKVEGNIIVEEDFLCPITQEVMIDPVVVADGHTYDRSAIEKWFKEKKRSPMTNLPLARLEVQPNYALRKIMEKTGLTLAPINGLTNSISPKPKP
jgi:ankyrin repeat protein